MYLKSKLSLVNRTGGSIKDEPNLYSTNLLVLKFPIREKKTIKSMEKETL